MQRMMGQTAGKKPPHTDNDSNDGGDGHGDCCGGGGDSGGEHSKYGDGEDKGDEDDDVGISGGDLLESVEGQSAGKKLPDGHEANLGRLCGKL